MQYNFAPYTYIRTLLYICMTESHPGILHSISYTKLSAYQACYTIANFTIA